MGKGQSEYRALAEALEDTAPACRDDWRYTLDTLLAMIPPPKSVRDVMARNGWGTHRASSALQAFRAVTSNSEERSRNAEDASVTPFLSPLGEERVTLLSNGARA